MSQVAEENLRGFDITIYIITSTLELQNLFALYLNKYDFKMQRLTIHTSSFSVIKIITDYKFNAFLWSTCHANGNIQTVYTFSDIFISISSWVSVWYFVAI